MAELTEWRYHEPVWEHERLYNDVGTPWWGHKRFVYDWIRNVRPGTIVELGTHKGTSFFAMCQAVKDAPLLGTDLSAVDTWRGDPHAGFYGPEVLRGVQNVIREYYDDVWPCLYEMEFDEAALLYEEGDIDLLHIDGYHTLEAVTHDFETWEPKVAEGGLIMLHDTAVQGEPFGVYRLWARLQADKRFGSFEFYHSHGLGLLRKGREFGPEFKTAEWRRHYQTGY